MANFEISGPAVHDAADGSKTMSVGSHHAEPEFFTKRLQLAIYLHASGGLNFRRVEPVEAGKLAFVFADPDEAGPELELEFERGASVSAKNLFASQTFLRRQMSEGLNEDRKIGEPHHGHKTYPR
jgi:hypothetical protein